MLWLDFPTWRCGNATAAAQQVAAAAHVCATGMPCRKRFQRFISWQGLTVSFIE